MTKSSLVKCEPIHDEDIMEDGILTTRLTFGKKFHTFLSTRSVANPFSFLGLRTLIKLLSSPLDHCSKVSVRCQFTVVTDRVSIL